MGKIKVCKGTGNAKGFGCNNPLQFSERNGLKTYKAKYGLCPKCQYEWATSNNDGKEWFSKQLEIKKKKTEKEIKQKKRKEKEKTKIDLMSADKYRAKYVQPIINKIARLIDYGNPCIATGNFEGKMAGGHFTSVGSNRTICLNLHNIFIQSFHSNSWNGGDDKRYRASLERIFGIEYLEFVDGLNAHRPIQLRKPQLIEIKENAQKIALDLEKSKLVLTPINRIKLRNKINIKLGIYDKDFCEFKL